VLQKLLPRYSATCGKPSTSPTGGGAGYTPYAPSARYTLARPMPNSAAIALGPMPSARMAFTLSTSTDGLRRLCLRDGLCRRRRGGMPCSNAARSNPRPDHAVERTLAACGVNRPALRGEPWRHRHVPRTDQTRNLVVARPLAGTAPISVKGVRRASGNEKGGLPQGKTASFRFSHCPEGLRLTSWLQPEQQQQRPEQLQPSQRRRPEQQRRQRPEQQLPHQRQQRRHQRQRRRRQQQRRRQRRQRPELRWWWLLQQPFHRKRRGRTCWQQRR